MPSASLDSGRTTSGHASPPGVSDGYAARPLSDQEDLLRALFHGPVSMAISGADGRWRRVNDSFLRMTGFEPDEALGKTGAEMGLFPQPTEVARLTRSIRRGAQVRDAELAFRRKNGQAGHLLASVEPVKLSGDPCTIWIFVEISGRKRAVAKQQQYERELKQKNRLLEGLTRAQAAYIGQGESRRVFDDMLVSLVDVTGSQFGFIGEVQRTGDGTPFLLTYAMTDLARTTEERALFEKHQRGGLEFHDMNTLFGLVIQAAGPVNMPEELEHAAGGPAPRLSLGGLPPGHPVPFTFIGLPVIGSQGGPVGVIGLADRAGGYPVDLVQSLQPLVAGCGTLIEAQKALRRQREAEQALRDSEERFRLLVDGARDYALLMLDPFGRVTNWNAGAEQITGYSASESVDIHFSRFYAAEAVEAGIPDAELRAAEDQGRCEVEGWRVSKDGTRFWASMVLTALRDGTGVLRGYAQLTRDITQRKQLERMKNEFVSVVSHELRTPLTAIRGAMSLLQGGVMGPLPASALELVEIARSNCERLVRLINDILDIEKIEAGMMDLRLVRLEPERLVARTLDSLRAMAREAGVEVGYELVLADDWRGDEDRVIQVLTNLVSNAVKFSPPGGHVIVQIAPGERSHVRVSVRDQGQGIPADKMRLLFGKFQQLDGSDSRKKGGTGLGLAISKAIVEHHGGAIGVESTPGIGSTFWFELPRWEAAS